MKFSTNLLGKNFHHLPTVDSTQNFLKNLLKTNQAPIGTLILADHQQTGKGTQGRSWFSLPNPQLMFSLLIKPHLAPQKLPLINILCGILMAKSLEEFNVHAMIKWPNDVYIDGKKVGGILSELTDGKIVLGVGINVEATSKDFPAELEHIATAVSLHAPNPVDRHELLNQFLIRLEEALEWKPDDLISFCQREFEKRWIYRGEKIQILQDSRILQGISHHITSSGALELITDTGVEKIIGGTISPLL